MEQVLTRNNTAYLSEVCSNIYRIRIPLEGSSLQNINSYLIKGDDRNLLIDTGYRNKTCTETIRASMAEVGADLADTDILLTHFHNDHSGAATDLIRPGRSIYVPEQEYQFFGIARGPNVYKESRRDRYILEGISSEEFDKMMYFTLPGAEGPDFFSHQFVPIKDSQKITAGDYTLTAVHTPGHTPGHMCYWEENHKLMFTGDHILFDITPNIIPWPGIPNILGLYLYSLQKLQNYPAVLSLPGHREPGSLAARLDEQIRHHQTRLEECRSLIAMHPGQTARELTKMLSWNIRRPKKEKRDIPLPILRYAFGECLSHLDYLYYQQKITRTFLDGARRYRVSG